MKIIYKYQNLNLKKKQVVTIGFFDGFHLGHQKIAKQALTLAKKDKKEATLVTFHPIGDEKSRLLTTRREKLYLLKKAGFDRTIVLGKDNTWRSWTPKYFIENFLMFRLNADTVVVGEDFRFGKNRAGDTKLLEKYSSKTFKVNIVKLMSHKKKKISSTIIRKIAESGDLEKTKALTGRNYFFISTKVAGKSLGKKIGYPTINFRLPHEKILPSGVFGCRALLNSPGKKVLPSGICYIGPVNIGKKQKKPFTVELHLFKYSKIIEENINGVELLIKIREPKKFLNVDELKLQIKKDISKAKVDIKKEYR